MKHASPFRIILMMIFAALAVVGIIVFSTFRSQSNSDQLGKVVIWGTLDSITFNQYLESAKKQYDELERVSYVQFNEKTFKQDVLESLASGAAPDLLFISDGRLRDYFNKVYTLTPESYSRSLFQDNFNELSEIYFHDGGIIGLPLAADPLVMYWNRDIFASEGLVRPPSSWSEFFELAQKLSIIDDSLNIKRSAVAFGETSNVDYFRSIIATLILQLNNPITIRDSRGNIVSVIEGNSNYESAFPALRFFTEFSDASKAAYSWNRSLSSSEEAFLSGKLALYFAPASRVGPLRKKNPNLNFAIAEIPSVDKEISQKKSVHADLYGFVIPRASKNVSGAFRAAVRLTESEPMQRFVDLTGLAPVRRDLIAQPSQETYQDVLKKESLYAKTFLGNDAVTGGIMSDMVRYITSGQRSINDAIYVANSELNEYLSR